jgi:hypothetical protein
MEDDKRRIDALLLGNAIEGAPQNADPDEHGTGEGVDFKLYDDEESLMEEFIIDRLEAACEAVGELHEAMESRFDSLSSGLAGHILTPVLHDIARLALSPGANGQVRLGLDEILDKYDARMYVSRQGDVYEPSRHRASGWTVSTDRADAGKISECISPGYVFCGRILLHERVLVYRFDGVNLE